MNRRSNSHVSHRRQANAVGRAGNRMRAVAEGTISRDLEVQRSRKTGMPPLTDSTITVTQAFQGVLTLQPAGSTGGSFGLDVSYARLAELIPGGLTYWSRMRVEKVSVWLKPEAARGTAGGFLRLFELEVTIPGNTNTGSPPRSFRDNAIDGATLPMVSWRFGLAQRQRWVSPAAGENLFRVSTPGIQGTTGDNAPQVFLVATVQLVSSQVNTG